MKKAISFTIEAQNVLWLKGQAGRGQGQTASAIVDRLVTEARLAGRSSPASVRSVCGTIDLPDGDPDLVAADSYIAELFERSVRRPAVVKESTHRYRKAPKQPRG